jgi:hypothetical protein
MAHAASFHRWFHLVLAVLTCGTLPYCLAGIVSWFSRKGRIGRLIVDASRPRSRVRVGIWIIFALLWAAGVATEPAQYLLSFGTTILISTGTALLLDNALEIREGGIFSDWLIISWNRVKSWCWEDAGGARQAQWSGKVEPAPAILRMELVKPLFFRNVVQIRVPFAQVDAVERAVAKATEPSQR